VLETKHDELVTSFGFNFKLRRYIEAELHAELGGQLTGAEAAAAAATAGARPDAAEKKMAATAALRGALEAQRERLERASGLNPPAPGGAVQDDSIKARVESVYGFSA
jgi:hypothetical protein